MIGDTSSTGVGAGTGETDPDILRLATVGEACDRVELNRPGVQDELVKAVVAVGKPTIVVMVQGRPFSVAVDEGARARDSQRVLSRRRRAARPSPKSSSARSIPSGRLPVSVVQSAGHVPTTYDYAPQGRNNYVDATSAPLWSFGYGLSYTSSSIRT